MRSGKDIGVPQSKDTKLPAVFTSLQQRLRETLRGVVPDGSRIAYVDIPVHKNVGDLLIYLGTKVWIDKAKLDVLGIWSLKQFSFPELPSDTVIVGHGGGNLGDIYPEHENLRIELTRRYRRHRIIILPQSVHFREAHARDSSLDAYLAHSDCFVACRDQPSWRTMHGAIGERALLAPDMATMLYPLRPRLGLDRTLEGRGTFYLMRTDEERATGEARPSLGPADSIGDWNELLGVPLRLASRLLIDLDAWARPELLRDGFERAWEGLAWRMVGHCAARMARYQRIVTSRLHGHIMASLLDLPNELHDNNYGKNSRYFSVWHREMEIASLVAAEFRSGC
jgi:pyruvyl transferase EpsO